MLALEGTNRSDSEAANWADYNLPAPLPGAFAGFCILITFPFKEKRSLKEEARIAGGGSAYLREYSTADASKALPPVLIAVPSANRRLLA